MISPSNTSGFYDVNYTDANIFELYAGASQQLVPEKFWFDGKVYFRSPKLNGGGTIPYEEKLGIEGAISYKVVKALTINSWAEYIGARRAPSANSDLSAFVLLNAGAEYQFNDTFGVYAKLLNILGQQYEVWNGYQERPFQIFGGLTIKF
jgi:outer membrane cobalamin receptor